ncbi:MAG: hypothetical protein JO337_00080 [Acidimicrobiales bacterium]|nr:hypothetical protein [Acidimicrobiales bacterium]
MSNGRTRRKNQASAIVRATCPTCGDVELSVTEVQVQICVTTAASTYSLLCPSCRVIVNKQANESVVESLAAAGARMMVWTLPAELDEPKLGPKITYDDLLEFHLGLEGETWQEELAALAANG